MPACVPNLDQSIVLSNYTHSQYASSLNDTKYSGIGIGSDKDWIVVILTTGTPTGNFATGSSVPDNFVAKLSPIQPMLCVLIGIFYLLGAYWEWNFKCSSGGQITNYCWNYWSSEYYTFPDTKFSYQAIWRWT